MNGASRTRDLAASLVIATGCALILLLTSPAVPIVWDEGDTIFRAEEISAGDAPWPYTTVREGHPPLAGLLVAVGERLAPRWLDPLTRYRLGPCLFFALAAGTLFYRLRRDYQLWIVPVVSVAVLLTMPRMFAHAHFATLDGPLTAGWILAWAAFSPACKRAYWIPLFGLALGLTFAAKFTGWLAVAPFLIWATLYRDRRALLALAMGVPLAVAVFVALNPPLWSDPMSGLRTFFALNLNRGEHPGLNITTQFLGRLYDLDHPLPFYNTLVWTLIVVSPMSLLLAGIGVVATVRRWRTDPVSMLLVLQWATLLVVRALPWAPPHDGIRLFLPSFAFLAALAGVGAGRGLYRETLYSPRKIIPQGWAKVAIGIALTMGTLDAVSYFPHGLSFYNRLIGGLRGATALGMEPTYWWDALDDDALKWLARNTGPDEKVAFAAAPPKNLELLKSWGRLALVPSDAGQFRWYVIQHRPSAWSPVDRRLIEEAQPAYQKSFKGVPLLSVYAYDDYVRLKSTAR